MYNDVLLDKRVGVYCCEDLDVSDAERIHVDTGGDHIFIDAVEEMDVRSRAEIEAKRQELREYDDYDDMSPSGQQLRYKHQGWLDALLWVLGNDTLREEP